LKAPRSVARRIGRRVRKSSVPQLLALHRAWKLTLSFDALEDRTLLATNPVAATSIKAGQVAGASPASIGILPQNLIQSVQDAETVATVAFPSSSANVAPGSLQSIADSHIYTGKPTNFLVSVPINSGGTGTPASSSTPPTASQASQAALAALADTEQPVPQYLVLPTNYNNTSGAGSAAPQRAPVPAADIRRNRSRARTASI
jgi:hypothetical protein